MPGDVGYWLHSMKLMLPESGCLTQILAPPPPELTASGEDWSAVGAVRQLGSS